MTVPRGLDDVVVVRAGRERMIARGRHDLGAWLSTVAPAGSLLLRTCLRVELLGEATTLDPLVPAAGSRGASVLRGEAAVRHIVEVAIGLDSATVGEDQVLHQLRQAVTSSRARYGLSPVVGRIADTALRTGRRARSWLPASRPTMADVALDGIGARPEPGQIALVVGAGTMGALAARALRARGWQVAIADRTPERAAALARDVHGTVIPLEPEAALGEVGGVIVAVSTTWPRTPSTSNALTQGRGWVIDLSAPPALDEPMAQQLGDRYWSIDDVHARADTPDRELLARLHELADETVAEIVAWSAATADRAMAAALAHQAESVRTAELRTLWARLDGVSPEQRRLIESMAERLAARLLQAPLERLGSGSDGRYERAARDLFGL